MKLILVITFMITCQVAAAQFVKGDRFIAGGFLVSAHKSSTGNGEENRFLSFFVSPEVGFFLNERYAIGGGLSYSTSTRKYELAQGSYQKVKNWGLGAYFFVKRYFPISEKFFFSLDGSVGYDRGRSTTGIPYAESTNKSYSMRLDATPSLIFFPSHNWAIEGSIGSLSLVHSRGVSDESKSTTFGLNYGGISLGFAYFFRQSAE